LGYFFIQTSPINFIKLKELPSHLALVFFFEYRSTWTIHHMFYTTLRQYLIAILYIFHSINFITSHDGYTLMDLASYESKNNFENGESNRDGENINYSQNFGFEGQTDNTVILKKREKQVLNMATILLVSQGTPMILAGDEFGRTQGGNNNAWCQDNEVSCFIEPYVGIPQANQLKENLFTNQLDSFSFSRTGTPILLGLKIMRENSAKKTSWGIDIT